MTSLPVTYAIRLPSCDTASGHAPIHGTTEYSLPTQAADGTWTPGAWHRVEAGAVEYRAHGVHVCMPAQLGYWAQLIKRVRPGLRTKVWVVEYRGQVSIGAANDYPP